MSKPGQSSRHGSCNPPELVCEPKDGLCDDCMHEWLNRAAPKGNWRARRLELEAAKHDEQLEAGHA